MTEKSIHRSATREQQIIAERAEDVAERRGIARGISLSIAFLAANGHDAAAEYLSSAILIEASNGDQD
jgi:hypothetical protein